MLAVALVGLGLWAWEPLYWCVMTKKVTTEPHITAFWGDHFVGEPIRGFRWTNRWTDRFVREVGWYGSTGFVALQWFAHPGWTLWNPNGSIWMQSSDSSGLRRAPPWLWGVTDQSEPTIPEWMKDDAKWARRSKSSAVKTCKGHSAACVGIAHPGSARVA